MSYLEYLEINEDLADIFTEEFDEWVYSYEFQSQGEHIGHTLRFLYVDGTKVLLK